MPLPHRDASSHDGSMHTTIDLSPAAHERIKASAAARGVSMSRFLSDGVQAHIDQIAPPEPLHLDPLTGLPTIESNQPINSRKTPSLLTDNS